MLVRRCSIVFIEPYEDVSFDMRALCGGDGLRRTGGWRAFAPHLDAPVEVDAAQRELLGEISPSRWIDTAELPQALEHGVLDRLVSAGLLLTDDPRHEAMRERDRVMRTVHWHPLAALLHTFTRWSDVDSEANARDTGAVTAAQLREVLGKPPCEVEQRSDTARMVTLEPPGLSAFDAMLGMRATCRNFDPARAVTREQLSSLLWRTFAAQAQVHAAPDLVFLKKNVPSGGGLHPIEAYLVVQNVDGLEPGIYHYRADLHALGLLACSPASLREFMLRAMAQQAWFADAPLAIVMVARYDRTFWKYRRHAKGYRVVAMEAGHLSQMLYLAATDLRLGAFVTGAINERQIESALSLDPGRHGVLAMCGVGWRATRMETTELDPCGAVWPV